MNRKIKWFALFTIICLGLFFFCYLVFVKPQGASQRAYSAESLGIKVIKSATDKDGDGIDDATDILLGARAYIKTNPKYKSKYYKKGYPDDGYGVCTDVVWNAFLAAGYNLKGLVDQDIANNISDYTTIDTPDPNIDFRRVVNLNIFLERNAISLPVDFSNPEDWQAGDIVVFSKHIAICSDKRNKSGIPFIIHHGIKGAREKNEINNYKIIGHYRWKP